MKRKTKKGYRTDSNGCSTLLLGMVNQDGIQEADKVNLGIHFKYLYED